MGPANAGPDPDAGNSGERGVSKGYFCLYEHDNFKGGHWCIGAGRDRGVDLRDESWAGTRRPVDNGASSMRNTTGCHVFLFDGPRKTRLIYHARPHSVDADLTGNGADNRASSLLMLC
ncbi:hypothetical protein Sru01_61810 [Sphaerisporangium rufum]|uniref:Uncharacterized protein n=1 Tax=Sphaerisporangium rufum TaxID=1381558 RepID=A0A919R848_9ACTN|nr:peptidase inhibitor family I36 protein [Sphaerisporangium rufum]GII81199.1 hypothetical protein Sru01_61810 [Sphaerisporangium rufum]